jgi:hypothetical protein
LLLCVNLPDIPLRIREKRGKIQALCFQIAKAEENGSEGKSYKIDFSIVVCLMTIEKWL